MMRTIKTIAVRIATGIGNNTKTPSHNNEIDIVIQKYFIVCFESVYFNKNLPMR